MNKEPEDLKTIMKYGVIRAFESFIDEALKDSNNYPPDAVIHKYVVILNSTLHDLKP